MSVVAKQMGEQLMPYKTKSGVALELLYMEELTAEVCPVCVCVCVVCMCVQCVCAFISFLTWARIHKAS